MLRALYEGGIRHFDCASLPEIRQVREHCPDSYCYFMVPVALRGAAREAFEGFGVRHFMIDHASGLQRLETEIPLAGTVVFARMAVSHESAKFGAPPSDIPDLLRSIRGRGAEAALAFNVGTMVTRSEAYRHAIDVAAEVLNTLDFRVRLVDIGGGFPRSYPGYPTPPLSDYFATVKEASQRLPLQPGGELLCEPGRPAG